MYVIYSKIGVGSFVDDKIIYFKRIVNVVFVFSCDLGG